MCSVAYELQEAKEQRELKREIVGLSLEQEPKYTINGHALINRVNGEEIPADEPVFVLRARDVHAIAALARYANLIRDEGHKDVVRCRMVYFSEFVAVMLTG